MDVLFSTEALQTLPDELQVVNNWITHSVADVNDSCLFVDNDELFWKTNTGNFEFNHTGLLVLVSRSIEINIALMLTVIAGKVQTIRPIYER